MTSTRGVTLISERVVSVRSRIVNAKTFLEVSERPTDYSVKLLSVMLMNSREKSSIWAAKRLIWVTKKL